MTTKSQNATEQSEDIAETPRAADSKQPGKIQGNCTCGSGKLSGGPEEMGGEGRGDQACRSTLPGTFQEPKREIR